METHDAADIFAEIVTAFAAGGTPATRHGAIHHNLVAWSEIGAITNGGNFTRRFGADNQGQLALRECHAAEAPQIEMINRHALDAYLHLSIAGRRRWRDIGELKLAVGNQS